jgi:hypothetical protein
VVAGLQSRCLLPVGHYSVGTPRPNLLDCKAAAHYRGDTIRLEPHALMASPRQWAALIVESCKSGAPIHTCKNNLAEYLNPAFLGRVGPYTGVGFQLSKVQHGREKRNVSSEAVSTQCLARGSN